MTKKRNLSIKILAIVFLVVTLADLISTLMFGERIKYAEANPLYPYIGLTGIIVCNLLYVAFFYWIYTRSNKSDRRFIYLNVLVTVCIVKVLVVYNNIGIYLTHPTLEQVMTITPEMKTAATIKLAGTTILPLFIGIITYYFFKLDHHIQIKHKHGKKKE